MYVRVHNKWHYYFYRAIDKDGKTVDFHRQPDRDIAATQAFFRKARPRSEQSIPKQHRRTGPSGNQTPTASRPIEIPYNTATHTRARCGLQRPDNSWTICLDKLNTEQWLEVTREAHGAGLRTTATIMFGHVDHPKHWARHLLHIRALQQDTGGFTEFVPLPYVHMEAPLWRKGMTRSGPTFREAVLMHAVARLALHPYIANIQTSWVKMGPQGAAFCLNAGANDLGGTLMNESITRAAGGVNGQDLDAQRMQHLIASLGRPARQRTTLYASVTCD